MQIYVSKRLFDKSILGIYPKVIFVDTVKYFQAWYVCLQRRALREAEDSPNNDVYAPANPIQNSEYHWC